MAEGDEPPQPTDLAPVMTPAQFQQYMEQLPGLLAAAHGGGGATGGATTGQPGAAVAAAVGQLEPCHLGRDKMKRYNSGEIGKRRRSLRWHS